MYPPSPTLYQSDIVDILLRLERRGPVSTRQIAQRLHMTERAARWWLRRFEAAGLVHRPFGERLGWKLRHTRATAWGEIEVQLRLVESLTPRLEYHRLCTPQPIIRMPRQLALPLAA